MRLPPTPPSIDFDGVYDASRITACRSGFASWLRGTGLEIGAGSRPFPLQPSAKVSYGDKLEAGELSALFGTAQVVGGDYFVDARTLSGVPESSLDFVIEAHVIEHLFDPVGAIIAAAKVLVPGGTLLLAVPNKHHTFDHMRPETPLSYILRDAEDGGLETRRQAYEEHVRYVHPVFTDPIPESDIGEHAARIDLASMDIHVHAWSPGGFRAVLDACADRACLTTVAQVSVGDETLYASRKVTSRTRLGWGKRLGNVFTKPVLTAVHD